MIHAYDKVYLDKAQVVLGRMLDFAVYDLGCDISEFFSMFIATGFASRFERGDFSVIVGMSGVELAYQVIEPIAGDVERIKPRYSIDRSEEYWTGWALAYYQWNTALRFEEIVQCIPIKKILSLYSPYHEMDIRQFCDKMNELYSAANAETNLKTLRINAGISQRELAERSGVPLRTVQQYEQRQKNINKARGETLINLAQALCCTVLDLIEKVDVRNAAMQ